MKYICKKDCYVRNPQGVLQHFRKGEAVDYSDESMVCEHFESVDGKKPRISEKEEIMKELEDLGVDCSSRETIPALRKKLKDAEKK